MIAGAGIGGFSAAVSHAEAGLEHLRLRAYGSCAGTRLQVACGSEMRLRRYGSWALRTSCWLVDPRRRAAEVRRMDGTVLKRAESPPPELVGGPTVVALRPVPPCTAPFWKPSGRCVQPRYGSHRTGAGRRLGVLRSANGDVAEGDLRVGAAGSGSGIRCRSAVRAAAGGERSRRGVWSRGRCRAPPGRSLRHLLSGTRRGVVPGATRGRRRLPVTSARRL